MTTPEFDHKTIKHQHDAGDLHELTFSCYERRQLLTTDERNALFCRRLDRAGEICKVSLYAFVIMPEHVHLLLGGFVKKEDVSTYLFALKQPFSAQIKALLKKTKSPLLSELTIQERPGKKTFRFWQEGPGYDRNLNTLQAIEGSISYFHKNPVERDLCQRATEWRWSSARRFYLSEEPIDPDLPLITQLPREYLE